jgi:hypothetical protein
MYAHDISCSELKATEVGDVNVECSLGFQEGFELRVEDR